MFVNLNKSYMKFTNYIEELYEKAMVPVAEPAPRVPTCLILKYTFI